ncbi:MAG: NADH-quinone oxidoreductase subunit J [Chloroflexi bacterium]|jgi:NADH-quinone oxidoreductase subunit J|nr:NADH-quinone oxidoreductase subunit J [Chloroflexota bacterium]
MTPLQIVFLIVAAITLFSAVMVVSVRRLMHAALFLVLALFGVAMLFATLESRFYAVVQLLVYVGAIAILVIFAIMLTRKLMEDATPQLNRGWGLAAILAVVLFGGLTATVMAWPAFQSATRSVAAGGEDVMALGEAFVNPGGYVIPFEVASVLLLAALIGAVAVAIEQKGARS